MFSLDYIIGEKNQNPRNLSSIRVNERFIMNGQIYISIKKEHIKKDKIYVSFNGNTYKYTLFNETTNKLEEHIISNRDIECEKKYKITEL